MWLGRTFCSAALLVGAYTAFGASADADPAEPSVAAYCMEQKQQANDLATYFSALLHRNSQNYHPDKPITFGQARYHRKVVAVEFGEYHRRISGYWIDGSRGVYQPATKALCKELTERLRTFVASYWAKIERDIVAYGSPVWRGDE